jgi:anti-sigma regulatory factor (Ser/Thr protein kinase)
MPYYRCPLCGVTAHSAAGRFTANVCPNCSTPLAATDRVEIEERHPAAMSQHFAPEPESAAAARRELGTMPWNLDRAEFEVLELLVSELMANSVEHSGAGPGGSINVDVTVTDRLVRAEVRDEGPGFVPAKRTAASPLDSHWGLHLVEELADRWHVPATPRTLVWFEIDRVAAAAVAREPVYG